MNSKDIDNIIFFFENNKELFIETVRSGEFVGLATFMFNRSINELGIEDKSNFVDNFCHVLISTLVLSILPITDNEQVETKMSSLRQKLYNSIMKAITDNSNDIMKELGIESFSTTIH